MAQSVLSVDLALRRYADFGIAMLRAAGESPVLLKPASLGLADPPDAGRFADRIEAFCRQQDISVLLIDGPQGWRYPGSPIAHMRLCERVLNTPGKTGVPGRVKPSTYLPYIRFSIEVFQRLRTFHGWRLLEEDWMAPPSRRWLIESFPSVAWPLLGLPRLPAKARAPELGPWVGGLQDRFRWELPAGITHDQLQACVVLPAGAAIATLRPAEVVLAGVDPILGNDGTVYEGWIASPRLASDSSEP